MSKENNYFRQKQKVSALPSPEEVLTELDERILDKSFGYGFPFNRAVSNLKDIEVTPDEFEEALASLCLAGYIEPKRDPCAGSYFDFVSEFLEAELKSFVRPDCPMDIEWSDLKDKDKATVFSIFQRDELFETSPLLNEYVRDRLYRLYRRGFLEGSFTTNQFKLVKDKLPKWMIDGNSYA